MKNNTFLLATGPLYNISRYLVKGALPVPHPVYGWKNAIKSMICHLEKNFKFQYFDRTFVRTLCCLVPFSGLMAIEAALRPSS